MCCFAGPVSHVGSTRIFARAQGRSQALVYAMNVESPAPNAMILPLPTAPGTGDGGVEFVDLSAYPRFFDDLAEGFPDALSEETGMLSLGARPSSILAVQQVGSFEASFVPSSRDFERLDARFRLSPGVLGDLRGYGESGFAVFQFRPGRQDIHPMALRFPTRDPASLFFPTVHVHDGSFPPTADFDHTLYTQAEAPAEWGSSKGSAGAFMDTGRAAGLVDPARHVRRLRLSGRRENADTLLPGGVPSLIYELQPLPRGAERNPSGVDLFNYLLWLLITRKASEVRLTKTPTCLQIAVAAPGGVEHPVGPTLTSFASILPDVDRHMTATRADGSAGHEAKVLHDKGLTAVTCRRAGAELFFTRG